MQARRSTVLRLAPGEGHRPRRGSAFRSRSCSPRLAEFRVRGVATNVAFLQAVLSSRLPGRAGDHLVYRREAIPDRRIDRRRPGEPPPFPARRRYRQPPAWAAAPGTRPAHQAPAAAAGDPPPGSRQRLLDLGPEGFARWLRETDTLQVTDTTMRDAHQSLFATRMRTFDMLGVAPHVAHTMPQLFSAEVWGGATFDVALRFLHEDPWERLARLRAPAQCLFQMLLRGQNAVGYTRYPPDVVRSFVDEAHATGVDIFRIFDANNDVDYIRPAIEATLEAGAVAEEPCATPAISPTRTKISTPWTTTCG